VLRESREDLLTILNEDDPAGRKSVSIGTGMASKTDLSFDAVIMSGDQMALIPLRLMRFSCSSVFTEVERNTVFF
jgi:hypothetical protein